MKTASLSSLLLTVALVSKKALAQTYSTCNPLTSGSCPADPALGKSINVDFTSSSTYFTPQGNPTYGSNGVSFTIAKSGDSPQLISTFYVMFGHVEYVIQAAPGTGIVSSAVLQSDDLDEIDWEWLGADNTQVQSNYFGKGQTTTYNRGAFHPDPSNQNGFHTYTIDWTADQIVWSIDGTPVRTLTQASAEAGQYPQTPMQIKVGAWSGGDPSNQPGTIQWAGGPTNYGAGPYSMIMKSIAVTDYSTGTQYTYSGTSGSWQSIQAVGGKVNSGGNGASPAGSAAPAVTSTSNGAPMPFEGTHSDSSSTFSPPNIYPWVAGATTLQTSTVAEPTTYAGLPSGWTVTSSGKVVPPSGAASLTSPIASSTLSPVVLQQASSSASAAAAEGFIVTTGWDERGFPTVVTVAASAATAPKSYDQQGFLITSSAVAPRSTSVDVDAVKAADSSASPTLKVISVSRTGAASTRGVVKGFGVACGIVGGALIL